MQGQQPLAPSVKLLAILDQQKDRLLKASQYVLLFMSWYYRNHDNKLLDETYYQQYKAIFNLRRLYRLGYWVSFVRPVLQSYAELLKGLTLERFSALVINCSRFLFYLLDNVSVILRVINYPRYWYLKARRSSFTFLLVSLLASLVLHVRKLRVNFSKEHEVKLSELNSKGFLARLKEIDHERTYLALTVFSNIGDILPTV